MKALEKNKSVIAAILVFIFVMLAYNLFFKSDVLTSENFPSTTTIGDDLLRLRGELEAVNLDRSVLSSGDFLLLADFSVPVPIQPTGRPNPFEVIGR